MIVQLIPDAWVVFYQFRLGDLELTAVHRRSSNYELPCSGTLFEFMQNKNSARSVHNLYSRLSMLRLPRGALYLSPRIPNTIESFIIGRAKSLAQVAG